MLIETFILAIVIGFLRGGKIQRLSLLELRGFWLVPIAFLIQSGVFWAAVKGFGLGPSWVSPLLDTLSYFLLIFFSLRNWRLPGMRLLTIGIVLNTLVISLNGGVMPVDPSFLPEESRKALLAGQGTHGLMTSTTVLSFLADRFPFSFFGLLRQAFSVGDVFIDIGCFILVYKTMRKTSNIESNE